MMNKKPYLMDYIQEELSALDKKYGHFYAFGNKQFKDAMDPDLEIKDYTGTGFGGYLPTKNVESFLKERDDLYKKGVDQIKKDFTKEEIMRYTFSNHECYYSGDPTDAMDTLKGFGYTEKEVVEHFYSISKD